MMMGEERRLMLAKLMDIQYELERLIEQLSEIIERGADESNANQ